MVCCALDGYHSVCTYVWRCNTKLLDESCAVMYTQAIGVYKCTMTARVGASIVVKTQSFEVKGMKNNIYIVMYSFHLLL